MKNGLQHRRDIEALLVYLEARLSIPFDWASGSDCVSFAGGGVAVQTGVDPLSDIASWKNRREAVAVLRDLGGLQTAVDNRMDRIAPALAQRGDIGGMPDRLIGLRLMIIEGEHVVGPGESGLVRLPRSVMTIAWNSLSIARGGDDRE